MQPVDHAIAAVLEGDAARVHHLMRDAPELATARNMFDISPLHAAHFTGQRELEHALVPAGGLDLFLAAELGALEVVDRVLGAQPWRATDFDATGSTALHGACYWGQLAVTRRLLDAGADAGARTRDEFLQIPPLGSAIATTPGVPQPSDDEDIVLALVRELLERGADPTAARRDGMTPLHSAAWRGLSRAVQELLDAGADPAATAVVGPHTGQRAADTALSQGHLVLAARLDAGGADVISPYG